MSYDISAAGQRLVLSGLAMSSLELTATLWLKRDADTGTFTCPLSFDDGSNNNYFVVSTDSTGDLLYINHVTSAPSTDVDVAGPTFDSTNWFRVALVRSGTGSNSAKFYYATNSGLVSTAQVTVAASFTISRMTIGDHGTLGESFDGKIAHLKVWSRALSLGEVEAEWRAPSVFSRSSNIGHWLLPGSNEYRRDYSGNNRTLNGTGGIIGITEPPIIATLPRRRVYDAPAAAAGGGGVFNPYYYRMVSGRAA